MPRLAWSERRDTVEKPNGKHNSPKRYRQNIKLINEELNKDADPAIPMRMDPES